MGWAVGDRREHEDAAAWDAAEAEQLYRLLEDEVIPTFYKRDENGLPHEWVALMRESMAQLTGRFSGNRMVREYTEKYYVPLADAYRKRAADNCRLAAEIEDWDGLLKRNWDKLYFGNVTSETGAEGYRFQVQVYLDGLPPDQVKAELYAEGSGGVERVCQPLARAGALEGGNNGFLYSGVVPADRPVESYTPRIVPVHPAANFPLEAPLITWYR